MTGAEIDALGWWKYPFFALVFVAGGAAIIGGVLGIIFLVSSGIEGIGRHNEDHDRCLKQATNGYEIRECGR